MKKLSLLCFLALMAVALAIVVPVCGATDTSARNQATIGSSAILFTMANANDMMVIAPAYALEKSVGTITETLAAVSDKDIEVGTPAAIEMIDNAYLEETVDGLDTDAIDFTETACLSRDAHQNLQGNVYTVGKTAISGLAMNAATHNKARRAIGLFRSAAADDYFNFYGKTAGIALST